jgi:hypothetical protein
MVISIEEGKTKVRLLKHSMLCEKVHLYDPETYKGCGVKCQLINASIGLVSEVYNVCCYIQSI